MNYFARAMRHVPLDPNSIGSGGGGWASAAGYGLQFLGNMQAGQGARDIGGAQAGSLRAQAAQLDVNAGQQQAAAQRQAQIERHKAALVASRGLAVAAAGGGATTDPTVARLIAAIAGEGEYRSAVAIYQGEEAAREMRAAAGFRRSEADTAERTGESRGSSYTLAGMGALAKGASSLFAKYGNGGPSATAATDNGGWVDAGSGGGDFA